MSALRLMPVGEATELKPLAVIECNDAHVWDAWDACTELLDFDPAPCHPCLLPGRNEPGLPRPAMVGASSR